MATQVTFVLERGQFGPLVELADGRRFPAHAQVLVTLGGTVATLWLAVEDGTPLLTQICVRRSGASGPLKASIVHALPVNQLADEAVGSILAFLAMGGTNDDNLTNQIPRRRAVDDDLLRQVARAVQADGRAEPNNAVRASIPCSKRTASRYIALARERGFLKEER